MLKGLARLLAHKAFVALVDTATTALVGVTASPVGASGGAALGGVGTLSLGSGAAQAPKLYVPSKADILPPEGEGGGQVPTITVINNFNQDGSVRSEVQASGGKAESETLARGFEAAFMKFILREMQPGGLLYNFGKRPR